MRCFQRPALLAALLLSSALSTTSPATAEPIWSPLSGDWLVTVKANLTTAPQYPGSDQMALSAFPSLSIRRAGTSLTFSSPDDNIGFAIIDTGRFKLGPSAKFVSARNSSDYRQLAGLRDVDWTIEAGLFAEFWTTDNIRLRGDIRYGFHGHRGVVADLGADYVHRNGPWTLSGGPRLALGNTRFTNAMFGVTAAESLANGVLPAYAPSGGLTSAGVAAAVSYDWNDKWRTTLWGRYDRLLSDAGQSPIPTLAGSRNQFKIGATLAYTFDLRIP